MKQARNQSAPPHTSSKKDVEISNLISKSTNQEIHPYLNTLFHKALTKIASTF